MKKVADRVAMSYVVNILEMMLKFVLKKNPRGRKLLSLFRVVPPPLLLFLEVMAQSFLTVRMILLLVLCSQNQREVLGITMPMMVMPVFLPQY